ncbi:MAG: peptidase, partial [Xanthomonadaceae bacterium]|nr:peptidase [Xanthomonadaceae bacterium]
MRAICWIVLLLALAQPVSALEHASGLPQSVPQGSLVIGHTDPGSKVTLGERRVQVGSDGAFAFGVGRDEHGPLRVTIVPSAGMTYAITVQVTPRDWPVEPIIGAPPATVNPPPDVAARIEREQAQVAAARQRDDARDDYEQSFQWPVRGRISGRFGNQRIYVLPDGTAAPKAPHSGMDIAVPTGTPVLAPAAGLVTFVGADLYLTGGTVVLDHGHGVSSNFLHLSRIDVRV